MKEGWKPDAELPFQVSDVGFSERGRQHLPRHPPVGVDLPVPHFRGNACVIPIFAGHAHAGVTCLVVVQKLANICDVFSKPHATAPPATRMHVLPTTWRLVNAPFRGPIAFPLLFTGWYVRQAVIGYAVTAGASASNCRPVKLTNPSTRPACRVRSAPVGNPLPVVAGDEQAEGPFVHRLRDEADGAVEECGV